MRPITFDVDRTSYAITYGATTIITTNIDHNLTTGDLVYFEDFTTTNPAIDGNKIHEINSVDGHFITTIASDKFRISINTAGLNPIPPGVAVNVYFDSKRIIIPLEITYIE